ncbi:Splicing factor [Coemansia sp. RSA 678]|nr:Splicing factor [Coemansia sp. RSA 678]
MESELDNLNSLGDFLKVLPEKLEQTPYDYTVYTQWIELLRAGGDIDSLRTARQCMYGYLAVTSDLFLEWIADEESLPQALSDESVLKHIIGLYEMAVRERMSLIMWQRYVDFAAGLSNSRDEEIRAAAVAAFGREDYVIALLRQGVEATGAHYLQSQALWMQYCDYILHQINKAEGSQRDELVEQLQSVFIERLAQPHTGVDETFTMYSEFTTRHNAATYEQQMVDANKIVSVTRGQSVQRNAFEDRLVESEGSWAEYSRYISGLAADSTTQPAEICMLYERALVTSCYSPEVWSEYGAYVAGAFDDTQVALDVTYRGLRNCPWSGRLWAQCVRFAYAHEGYELASRVYARATDTHAVSYSMVEYGLLAVAWLAVTRTDPGCDDEMLLDTCDQCVDVAYKLDPSTADPVLYFERCCTSAAANAENGTERARKLWTRICKARRFCTEAWVLSAEFEAAHGSAQSARSVFRHAAQRKLDNPERLFDAWLALENTRGELVDIDAAERIVCEQRRVILRRAERAHTMSGPAQSEVVLPAKRQRSVTPEATTADQSTPVDRSTPADSAQAQSTKSDNAHPADQPRATTVFISSLPRTFTSADVEAFLGGPAQATNISMQTDKAGEFHGRATASMQSASALIAALDKNNTVVDGHHISVHIYKQHAKPVETTVAVRGFAANTTNKQIAAIAKPAGTVVRVRRNQSGDTAFVVMHSYGDAVRAEAALNGCVLDECTLDASIVKSGRAATAKQKDAKEASVTSLAPRKVARRPAKKVGVVKTAPARKPSGASTEAKSNAEFRQLFLGSDSKP